MHPPLFRLVEKHQPIIGALRRRPRCGDPGAGEIVRRRLPTPPAKAFIHRFARRAALA